jgi:hypothetical protein
MQSAIQPPGSGLLRYPEEDGGTWLRSGRLASKDRLQTAT